MRIERRVEILEQRECVKDCAIELGRAEQMSVVVDGLAAGDAVRRYKPDLVLMDIDLPGLHGWTATLRSGRTPTPQTSPSSRSSPTLCRAMRSARARGSSGYHAKPIDHDELIAQLERLLRERGS